MERELRIWALRLRESTGRERAAYLGTQAERELRIWALRLRESIGRERAAYLGTHQLSQVSSLSQPIWISEPVMLRGSSHSGLQPALKMLHPSTALPRINPRHATSQCCILLCDLLTALPAAEAATCAILKMAAQAKAADQSVTETAAEAAAEMTTQAAADVTCRPLSSSTAVVCQKTWMAAAHGSSPATDLQHCQTPTRNPVHGGRRCLARHP